MMVQFFINLLVHILIMLMTIMVVMFILTPISYGKIYLLEEGDNFEEAFYYNGEIFDGA